jgi:hypothetical protein
VDSHDFGILIQERALIRSVLRDPQWERIAPLLPGKLGDPGRSGDNDRGFLEAVLWIASTGSPWRDLHHGINTDHASISDWNCRGRGDRWCDCDVAHPQHPQRLLGASPSDISPAHNCPGIATRYQLRGGHCDRMKRPYLPISPDPRYQSDFASAVRNKAAVHDALRIGRQVILRGRYQTLH